MRDNRKSQMATMAYPEPTSANQQSLIEEASVLDFPELSKIKERKKRSKFERMPTSRRASKVEGREMAASQEARRVPEGKPKVLAAAAAAAAALAAAAAAFNDDFPCMPVRPLHDVCGINASTDVVQCQPSKENE